MCHRDSYDFGMGSAHSDIYHWFNRYGKDMDDVRDDVAALLKGMSNESTVAPTPVVKPEEKPVTNVTIEANDIVSLTSDAVYFTGKEMPTWVKSTKWIVKKVEGHRAVIDKSVDGKYAICSPVNIKYLKLEKDASAPITPVEPPKNVVVPNITYAVKTKTHGILPDVKNREDYAGFGNSEIVAIKIGVDCGAVEYRVHTVAGKWLPSVTGNDWNDFNNGYAGDDKTAIDAIEIYYITDSDKTGGKYYEAVYQVKGKGNSNYWANQHDTERENGQDGYAGAFGVPIVEIKMSLE